MRFEIFNPNSSLFLETTGKSVHRDSERPHSVPVNLYETDTHLFVCAKTPSAEKENLRVDYREKMLTLSYESKLASFENAKSVSREISEGTFKRTVLLPCKVEGDQIEAKLENGILTISMPKESGEMAKNITIQ